MVINNTLVEIRSLVGRRKYKEAIALIYSIEKADDRLYFEVLELSKVIPLYRKERAELESVLKGLHLWLSKEDEKTIVKMNEKINKAIIKVEQAVITIKERIAQIASEGKNF